MTARGIQDVAARCAREKAGLSRHRTEQEREERECPNLASPRKGSREKDAAIIHAAAAAAVDREAVTRSLYFMGRTMAKYLKKRKIKSLGESSYAHSKDGGKYTQVE